MTNFNIQRFGRTLKWSAVMTRKEVLANAAMMFFAMFFPFIVQMLTSYDQPILQAVVNLDAAMRVCIFIYFVVSMIGGSWLFNNMKTKEQRITFKMLPATDLEKYVARALYATVVWWLMGLAAFCLADVLRMFISLIAGIGVVKSTIPDFFAEYFGSSVNSSFYAEYGCTTFYVALLAMLYAWGFWVHSLYILGGAFFRRHQFVLTSLVHLVLIMVFTPLLVHFVKTVDNAFFNNWKLVLAWSGAVVFAALGVLDWWLSYKIFRRMQVVNNKWVNL